MDFFHSTLFGPLVVEGVIGCLIGLYSRWAIFRILAWLFLPVIIATAQAALDGLFTQTGDRQTFALFELVHLAGLGYLVSTVAIMLGYLMRRVPKSNHDT